MTRYYTNGIKSGEVYDFENTTGQQQFVLGDQFLVYTYYFPELLTETSDGGSTWRAEYSNKSIWKGNFIYKGDTLDLINSTYSEFAIISTQRMKDGSIEETAYGYKFGEGIPFVTSGAADDLASEVSFSYSNDPTTDWSGGSSPKLGSFPISNDRSTLEQSYFGKFVTEGWGDNPFHLNAGITIAAVNDSYSPDINGFSSVSGEAPVKITAYEVGEETTLDSIKDYAGNLHAGDNLQATASSYKYQGMLDVNGDGTFETIFTNKISKRWVTGEVDSITGQIDFSDHGAGGTTRVVGIYIDPLVTSGDVVQFSDHDSQYRFQNDLEIDNLVAKHSGDYDSDGVHEVYWKTADDSAYLRSLMHADGNIRYANYQSEAQMKEYLTANGDDSAISDIV